MVRISVHETVKQTQGRRIKVIQEALEATLHPDEHPRVQSETDERLEGLDVEEQIEKLESIEKELNKIQQDLGGEWLRGKPVVDNGVDGHSLM